MKLSIVLPPLLLAGLLASAPALRAAPKPLGAQALVAAAETRAAAGHKSVLVIFGASWCGWCHILDDLMDSRQAAPVFDKYFTVVRLDVDEAPARAAQDTPGGAALMARWGGSRGLPFLVMLRPSGSLIATSNATSSPGSNVGYPVKPNEVAWFMHMLHAGAPALSPAALAAFQRHMVRFNQKRGLR